MYVVKRDGSREILRIREIVSDITDLCGRLSVDHIDLALVLVKIVSRLQDGMTTVALANLTAEATASLIRKHPDYALLAGRIAAKNLLKETPKSFSDAIAAMYNYTIPSSGQPSPMVSKEVYDTVMKHSDLLNSAICYDRDFNYTYFGFKTLERSFLLKIDGRIAECPQHMLMRVAVGIHGDDINAAIASYNAMSENFFIHATQTLLHAGTIDDRLSKFLIGWLKVGLS